jgi:uncharacterized protein YqgC (DUF456 family)
MVTVTDWTPVIRFATLYAMVLGLIFTLIPPIPGTFVIWGAALVYGLAMGWEQLGWITFGLMTFLMLVGFGVDLLAGHLGARMGGASCLAVAVGSLLGFALGILASLVGTPLLGCLAGIGGMFGGILLVEWRRSQNWQVALTALQGYIAGEAVAAMARLTAGSLMFGLFLARLFLWR